MITQLKTRTVYENRWMKVREDDVRFPDGSEGIFGVVEKVDFVVIVPRLADGRFQLVEQYRYPVGARFWEFPQGAWETQPDADPLEVARGELAEETGFRAGKMEELGYLYEACGYSNQGFRAYLATDLTEGELERDAEEQDMVAAPFTLDEIKAMIRDGRIRDQSTVAALGLLMLRGEG